MTASSHRIFGDCPPRRQRGSAGEHAPRLRPRPRPWGPSRWSSTSMPRMVSSGSSTTTRLIAPRTEPGAWRITIRPFRLDAGNGAAIPTLTEVLDSMEPGPGPTRLSLPRPGTAEPVCALLAERTPRRSRSSYRRLTTESWKRLRPSRPSGPGAPLREGPQPRRSQGPGPLAQPASTLRTAP